MCVEIWKKFFLFLFDILDFKRNFKFQAITSTSDFFYFFNGLQAQAYFLQNARKKKTTSDFSLVVSMSNYLIVGLFFLGFYSDNVCVQLYFQDYHLTNYSHNLSCKNIQE